MKRAFIVLALVTAVPTETIAVEDQSPAALACAGLAMTFLTADVMPTKVLDFSELDPPHVRMSFGANTDAPATVVECTFDVAEPPLTLVEFCAEKVCLDGKVANDVDEDAVSPKLFLELVHTLKEMGWSR